jgi:hypothetical protein
MDWILANARKGEVWLEGRRLADRSLRPGTTASYRQMILEKTHWFLTQLLATPDEFRGHILLSVAIPPCVELTAINVNSAFGENLSCLSYMATT